MVELELYLIFKLKLGIKKVTMLTEVILVENSFNFGGKWFFKMFF